MLTTILLLASAIPAPLPHACESAAVERPGLTLAAPSWGFVVRPEPRKNWELKRRRR